jgi:hypothetical protein
MKTGKVVEASAPDVCRSLFLIFSKYHAIITFPDSMRFSLMEKIGRLSGNMEEK